MPRRGPSARSTACRSTVASSGTPDGGVVVADGGRLRRYEADWTRSLDVPLGDATDVAVGPGGLLYLADPDDGVVRVLSEDGPGRSARSAGACSTGLSWSRRHGTAGSRWPIARA